MEEERIQKFLDLILNEHYCEDCNELCSTGEAFPLEFVAKYIIKLKEDNKELKKYYATRKEVEDLKETIACLHESGKDYIPISVIENKLEKLKEKEQELSDDEGYWGSTELLSQIEVLEELLDRKE